MAPFTVKLRKKGWLAKEVAERWGVKQRAMSNIAKSPSQLHWDALEGLPEKREVDMGFQGYVYDEAGAEIEAEKRNQQNDGLDYCAEPLMDLGAYGVAVYDKGHMIGYVGGEWSRD